MHFPARAALAACGLMIASTAAAQLPVLTVAETLVAPGQPVRRTVCGGPGQFFAHRQQHVGSGGSLAGVSLDLGSTYTLAGTGVLDRSGRGTLTVTPNFAGESQTLAPPIVGQFGMSFVSATAQGGRMLGSSDLCSTGAMELARTTSQTDPLPAAAARASSARPAD